MPKFDVSWMPDALEWDFTQFPGFEATEKGTVPEPSGEQIRTFLHALNGLKDEKLPDMNHPLQWIDFLSDPEMEKLVARSEAVVAAAVHNVCSGTPSDEQYKRLPDVAKNLFLEYLIKNLLRPESRGAGSKESQVAPNKDGSGTSSVATSGSL